MNRKYSKEIQRVISNFGYLSVLQIISLIIPLLVFPYLIDVLGKVNYGLVIYGQAIVTFLVVIVNFGFNITATREISIHRNDRSKLHEVVSSVFILRIILLLIAFLILSLVLPFIKEAEGNYLLFYFSMFLCINEVMLPVWYFQGIEQMKYITIINGLSKLTTVIFIFLFINTAEDYTLVPLFYLIGTLISGTISLYIVFVKHQIKFRLFPFSIVFSYAKTGFYIFLSRASFMLMESTSKVIITKFFGLSDLAVYDLALKIVTVVKKPFSLLSQAFFPNLSKNPNIKLTKKLLLGSTLVSIVFYLIIVLLSDSVTLFFLDISELEKVYLALLILGISIPLSSLTWWLGENILVVKGYFKPYNLSTIIQIFVYFGMLGFFYFFLENLSFTLLLVLYIVPILAEVLVRIFYINKYGLFKRN
ncbi:oligosaccharide flippase family protein [Ascidiimonas sp. W6]|uniref:oligosaccharide flippase family protein n=1 Tax=Ascidiimonas meishanensis TaxID=3128903 RepID=UPI0030EB793E